MMKNVGKKFAALSMATLLAFGVLGCGSDKKDDAKVPAAVQTQKIDTPEGKIQKGIIDAVNNSQNTQKDIGPIKSIDINPLGDKYNVVINASFGSMLTPDHAQALLGMESLAAFNGAFNSGVPVAHAAFIVTDKAMNKATSQESMIKLYQAEMRDDQAKNINWKNVNALNPKDVLIKPFVHISIRK